MVPPVCACLSSVWLLIFLRRIWPFGPRSWFGFLSDLGSAVYTADPLFRLSRLSEPSRVVTCPHPHAALRRRNAGVSWSPLCRLARLLSQAASVSKPSRRITAGLLSEPFTSRRLGGSSDFSDWSA